MKIIEKIRKLFAMAESAAQIGNAEEAAAFAAKANELLLSYKIDMTELELQDEGDSDPMGKDEMVSEAWGATTEKWSNCLANGIAKANFCRLVIIGRQPLRYGLVGRASDREIVVYLIQTIHAEAKRLAKEYLATLGLTPRMRGYTRVRTSFLLGLMNAVVRRLNAQRTEAERAGGQYAVVRLKNADAEVAAAYAEMYPHATPGRSRGSVLDPRGYEAGQRAGAGVAVGGIGSGSFSKASRLLGA